MTTKLEQAARQIIVDWDSGIHLHETITALREALDHSGEANEMVGCAYCNNPLFAGTKCKNCGFITLAEQAEPNSTFMEGYRIGLADMREKCAKVVTEHAPKCSPHWVSYAAAIRAIKFEGDTGFRPVSEMIAEHKQDPKKGAAIEKAKTRKAEQKPVAFQMICPRCKVDRVTTPCPRGGISDCPMTATAQSAAQQPVKQEPVAVVNHEAGGSQKVTWLTLEGLADGAELYLHPVRTKDLTDELQQKCSNLGTYWRAPDAHGVNLSIEQATELLRDALGVDVEITPHVRTKDLTVTPENGELERLHGYID